MNFKSLFKKISLLLLIIIIFSCSEKKPDTQPNNDNNIVIFSFNDFHAVFNPRKYPYPDTDKYWSGAAVIGGYVNKFRTDYPESIIAFAGDMFISSPLDNYKDGATTVNIFNIIKPDIACLGNHEFDHGKPALLKHKSNLKYPLICANVYDKDTNRTMFEQYKIIERNGIKILFIGTFPTSSKYYYEKDHNIKVNNPITEIQKITRKLDNEVDMTILLSHSGKQDDIEIAEKIGKKTGIDLIIGGHSHDLIEKPIIINNIPIIQAGFNGKYFAKLILTPNKQNKTIKDYKYEIIKTFTDKVQPDKKIQDIVNNLVSENKDLFKVVCKTTIPLDNETRTQETQFGNFVVDNLVDMYNSDLAFVHSKTIRRSIGGPEITVNALYEALPYLDKSELVLMKGYQIKKLIEYFLNTKPDRILCIPYTLSYKYKQRYNDKYYVTELNFKGQPIDYNQFYQVVATSHDINNFKKYYDAKPVKKLSDNTLQDLINYLEQLKLYKPYKFGRFEKINQ